MSSYGIQFMAQQHQSDLQAEARASRLARMARDADHDEHEPVTWSVSQGHRRLATALAGLVLSLGALVAAAVAF